MIAWAGAERLGWTTATVGTAMRAVSCRRAVRAWMRGKIPKTTSRTAVTTASRRIHHEERRFFCGLGLPESAPPISLKTPLSFSTFICAPETYENIDDYS